MTYVNEGHDDMVAVPLGCFAPNTLPRPTASVFDEHMQPWIAIVGDGIVRE